MRRGLPTAGIVAIVLIVLASPVGILALTIPIVADRNWDRVEEESKKRVAELRARAARRPVLRGTPEAGNAFAEYSKALASFRSLNSLRSGPAWDSICRYVDGRPESSREEVQALLEPALPSLQLLRKGTRCEDVWRWRDWEHDRYLQDNHWQLQYVGICRLRLLAEEGNIGEAVDLLLDLFQHCTDKGRSGTMFENMLGQQRNLLGELRTLMASGMLEREHYVQFSRELALIDGQIEDFGEGMLNGAMWDGFTVLRTKTLQAWLEEWGSYDRKIQLWKTGFSERLALAKFAEIQLRTAQRIAEGDSKPWAEAKRLTVEASEAVAGSTNPLLSMPWAKGAKPDWLPLLRGYRETRAQIRLMRAAVGYLATGTVPDLEDPFGDRLKSAHGRRGLRIWSVGADGVDDGGSGSWNPRSGRDIVLEVGR